MSEKYQFKYVYGPVESWRMGKSLGVDPISEKSKVCNLDCSYCQLGRTCHLIVNREIFVPTESIIEEIKLVPEEDIDYITFSGRGEPTLAQNLGEMIRAIREIRKEKIAIITNSTLLYRDEVCSEVALCDLVMAKLDAYDEESFQRIEGAPETIQFENVVSGIKKLRQNYQGKLALQVMFVKENQEYAEEMAALVEQLGADEIQLNTPLRPSREDPLDEKAMNEIKKHFSGLPVVTVYEREHKKTTPYDDQATINRHGNFES